ncbi:MAG: GDP-mannose 4,6-dehydratase [Chromatocurvus sp.]
MSTWLLTGGAGFIGSNYAARLLARGETVILFDNLSRGGSRVNLQWLQEEHTGGQLEFVAGDVRDQAALRELLPRAEVVVHLAAQVAVTNSVVSPREDFEINALGTLNVLEAARDAGHNPVVLYASTNKVYGALEQVPMRSLQTRFSFAPGHPGIDEQQPLDFHSPYGCSKGCGDQYVRDYNRIYGLPTVVLRQSCIYGPRQFGIEEQGWLAWLIIAALHARPISIYGDGRQVRDVLHVEDLLDVYDAAVAQIDVAAGEVFNVGGGPKNSIAVWSEFGPLLEQRFGRPIPVQYGKQRKGDQPVYISDIRKLDRLLGCAPRIGLEQGLDDLCSWIHDHAELL